MHRSRRCDTPSCARLSASAHPHHPRKSRRTTPQPRTPAGMTCLGSARGSDGDWSGAARLMSRRTPPARDPWAAPPSTADGAHAGVRSPRASRGRELAGSARTARDARALRGDALPDDACRRRVLRPRHGAVEPHSPRAMRAATGSSAGAPRAAAVRAASRCRATAESPPAIPVRSPPPSCRRAGWTSASCRTSSTSSCRTSPKTTSIASGAPRAPRLPWR